MKTNSLSPNNQSYAYDGYDANAKYIKGTLFAESLSEAKAQLEKDNIYIKNIKIKKENFWQKHDFIKKIIKKGQYSEQLYYFTKQLSALLKAGFNLEKSLKQMKSTMISSNIEPMINEIHFDLTKGLNFYQAIAKHPDFFPDTYLCLIKVASESRRFNEILENLATNLKKRNLLNQEIKRSLAYPKFIFWISIILSSILLIKIVPIFEEIYRNAATFDKLPNITKFIINFSNILENNFFILVSVFFLIYLLLIKALKTQKTKKYFDYLILKIPKIAPIVIKNQTAQIFRMIATLTNSKVSIVEAIQLVAESNQNFYYKQALFNISKQVSSGHSLYFCFSQYKIFPHYAKEMIATGENSNQLHEMLEAIAAMYESEVEDSLQIIKTFIEPISIILLSFIIAFIVIAMYLPIFSMGETLYA